MCLDIVVCGDWDRGVGSYECRVVRYGHVQGRANLTKRRRRQQEQREGFEAETDVRYRGARFMYRYGQWKRSPSVDQ